MDEHLFDENSEYIYEDKSIYILHYPMGKVHVSFGYGIQKEDEYYIKHLCNTEHCSSGSPILNLKSNNVIGIHSGLIKNILENKEVKYNIGVLLKYPLNEINKIKEINEIKPIKKKEKKNEVDKKKETELKNELKKNEINDQFK